MSFSEEELLNKKQRLENQLVELELQYLQIVNNKSTALQAIGKDVLSLRHQIESIDQYLIQLTAERSEKIPRRESLPVNPTIVVSGNPTRRGIPNNSALIEKSDGSTYFVDKQGKVISSEADN